MRQISFEYQMIFDAKYAHLLILWCLHLDQSILFLNYLYHTPYHSFIHKTNKKKVTRINLKKKEIILNVIVILNKIYFFMFYFLCLLII